MTQNLKDLYHTLDRNLAPFANKENITEKELEMFWGGNFMRVWEQTIKVAQEMAKEKK